MSRLVVRSLAPVSFVLAGCGAPPPPPSTVELPTAHAAGRTLDVAPGGASTAKRSDERRPVVWHAIDEEDAIRKRARASGRPVVVRFFASWDAADRELDKTMTNGAVTAELERFETILVDATDDEAPSVNELETKYRVVGLPAIVIFDGAGTEAARINEVIEPRALATILKRIHGL